MLTPREMEYLISISKTKSITKSAIECNVSQPALTMQLNKIESIFGFKIFNRQRGNTAPTTLGRKVIQKCEIIMKEMLDLQSINTKLKEVNIGIIPTVSPYLLPKITQNLTNKNLKIYFYDLKTSEILEKLQSGALDCGIIANYKSLIKEDKFSLHHLYNEEFVFATHKSINISIEEGIASQDIILLEDGNCVNLSIKEICNAYKTKHSFSATSIEVVKAMIAGKNGYGILPESSINDQNASLFNIKRFNPKKTRQISLLLHKDANFLDFSEILNIFHKIG